MKLVKILYNDDGDKEDNPQWHLVSRFGDSERAVCTGEVFGEGEGAAVFESKERDRGITCPRCIDIVKWFKKVKL